MLETASARAGATAAASAESATGNCSDPVVNQPQAALVDDRGSEARHPAGADLGHAVKQDRSIRIAGRQDARVRDVKGSLSRTDADDSYLRQIERGQQLEIGVAAAPLAMTVRAVGVQIRAGPAAKILALRSGSRPTATILRGARAAAS